MELLTQPTELKANEKRTDYITRDDAADIANSLQVAADGDPVAIKWLVLYALALGLCPK